MPNWCSNTVTISHTDPAEIKRVIDAYNQDKLFEEFFPCPEDLKITAGKVGADGSPEQVDLEAKEASNIEKYGFPNWYDWCVNNWGTKWDMNANGNEIEFTEGQTVVDLYFDTAWAPPIGVYQHLEDECGFVVNAMYYEPGMTFCGVYADGIDDYFEITGDSQWVIENIPSDINDAFGISDEMAQWEDEQAEEEEGNDNETV